MNKYYALEQADKEADITIFGDITSMPWMDSDVSSYDLAKEIEGLQGVDRINVHINSYGGEVSEALAITNALIRYPAQVTTYVDGFACSAATIVFMAGDRRVMSRYSNFLIHPAWVMVEGNADALRKEADNLDAITEQSVKAYLDRINRSRDELLRLMSEERFMTPEEVLDWGFATEIEEPEESDKPSQSAKQMVYDLAHPEYGNRPDDVVARINKLDERVAELCKVIDKVVNPEVEESATDPVESEEKCEIADEKFEFADKSIAKKTFMQCLLDTKF